MHDPYCCTRCHKLFLDFDFLDEFKEKTFVHYFEVQVSSCSSLEVPVIVVRRSAGSAGGLPAIGILVRFAYGVQQQCM